MASLAALAEVHARHGHLQEVILQNFVPHQSYYGQEPAEIAGAAAEEYWRTGVGHGPQRDAPSWASAVSVQDMVRLVAEARRLMPGIGIQVPPNLADWWPQLVAAGRHRPRRPERQRRSHLTRASLPVPDPGPPPARARTGSPCPSGSASTRSTSPRSGSPRRCWTSSPAASGRSSRAGAAAGAASSASPTTSPRGRSSAPATAIALSADELTALFAEQRPAVIEDLRAAADELRRSLAGDTVTFVVNRNINVSNVCVVGCAFCGFGQSKRSPDAYEHSREDFASRVQDAIAVGATELCIQSGIHPDWTLEDYLGWLRFAKEIAPEIHLHAYSPMEISHMCDVSGLAPREVFSRLREAGLGSTPGTAAEVLHDGVRERISPNKLPVARWVEIIEASHAEGIRSTATVMFGHIEEPWELAEHMRVVRELQERTGGFTEFVPLSFIPFHTLLGRTHGVRGDLPRGEPQAHGRLPPRPRPDGDQPAGQLGQDGTRRRHRGAALGGQRPRRHADGGVDLAHGRQLPRRSPDAGGARRRGAPRGTAGGGAHDALLRTSAL